MAIEKSKRVGESVCTWIKSGLTNSEVLATVQLYFPEAKTSLASVVWYRCNLRRTGVLVPTDHEVRRRRKAA